MLSAGLLGKIYREYYGMVCPAPNMLISLKKRFLLMIG
jgi:hypothetical protein